MKMLYSLYMIHLTFYTVGDVPKGPFSEIRDHYLKLLTPYVKLEHRVIKEADSIIEKIKPGEPLIVLDALGYEVSTEKLASYVKEVESRGTHIMVLLGGPKGVPNHVKKLAKISLSLSRLTTTHDIAHIFFLEQLYRVSTINAGKAYNY